MAVATRRSGRRTGRRRLGPREGTRPVAGIARELHVARDSDALPQRGVARRSGRREHGVVRTRNHDPAAVGGAPGRGRRGVRELLRRGLRGRTSGRRDRLPRRRGRHHLGRRARRHAHVEALRGRHAAARRDRVVRELVGGAADARHGRVARAVRRRVAGQLAGDPYRRGRDKHVGEPWRDQRRRRDGRPNGRSRLPPGSRSHGRRGGDRGGPKPLNDRADGRRPPDDSPLVDPEPVVGHAYPGEHIHGGGVPTGRVRRCDRHIPPGSVRVPRVRHRRPRFPPERQADTPVRRAAGQRADQRGGGDVRRRARDSHPPSVLGRQRGLHAQLRLRTGHASRLRGDTPRGGRRGHAGGLLAAALRALRVGRGRRRNHERLRGTRGVLRPRRAQPPVRGDVLDEPQRHGIQRGHEPRHHRRRAIRAGPVGGTERRSRAPRGGDRRGAGRQPNRVPPRRGQHRAAAQQQLLPELRPRAGAERLVRALVHGRREAARAVGVRRPVGSDVVHVSRVARGDARLRGRRRAVATDGGGMERAVPGRPGVRSRRGGTRKPALRGREVARGRDVASVGLPQPHHRVELRPGQGRGVGAVHHGQLARVPHVGSVRLQRLGVWQLLGAP